MEALHRALNFVLRQQIDCTTASRHSQYSELVRKKKKLAIEAAQALSAVQPIEGSSSLADEGQHILQILSRCKVICKRLAESALAANP
jgi:hypothetical protein